MAFIEPCFGIGHNLSLICQMTSEDIKHHLIITKHVEKRSKESDKMKKNEDGKQAEAEDDEVMPPRKATPVVVRTSSDRLLHLAGVRLPDV